jgi:hypothetical protein
LHFGKRVVIVREGGERDMSRIACGGRVLRVTRHTTNERRAAELHSAYRFFVHNTVPG